MCDLKSFTFSHHFGSGFKYFSAVIICKLSKILNLRLSGGKDLTHITQINTVLEKRSTRERFYKGFPKTVFFVLIVWRGDGRRQAYYSMPARRSYDIV